MNLKELCIIAHEMAKSKGFWEGHLPNSALSVQKALSKLCLIHSEVSEACEAARDGHIMSYHIGEKPEGLPSEMADIVIRVADYCGATGIDLQGAVEKKMAYNAKRPHKHGRLA